MSSHQIDSVLLSHINLYNHKFIDNKDFISPYFYCLIKHTGMNYLSLACYSDTGLKHDLPIIFSAKSAEVLCKLLQLHGRLKNYLSPGHALYLGRELIKAELAMIAGQKYIQN